VQQTATSFAKANLPVAANLALPDQIVASADMTNALVTVSIVRTVSPILSALNSTPTTISASATAQYRSAPICVLALSSSGVAFDAKAASNLTASGCAILSNSTATDGLTAHTNGLVSSQKTCSAGGYSGNSFSPTPITDCPGSADPLASRSPPSNVNDACQYTDYAFSDGALPLTPGVYCGGIAIKHGAAMFMPGDYIIRGGTLEIKAGGSMNGVDVGFYLTGGANLAAQANSALSLEAPSDPDDPMVGLVFWEDPHNMPAGSAATHTIDADNGQNLHGTVYFPQGSLYIGGNAKVGAASAYTIIVANNLVVDQQANVVLNSNYTASAIPAPQGVGNTGGTAYLAQ